MKNWDMATQCCNGYDGVSPTHPPAPVCDHARTCEYRALKIRSMKAGNAEAVAHLDWATNVGLSEPGRE